jgi:hypothetical protein
MGRKWVFWTQRLSCRYSALVRNVVMTEPSPLHTPLRLRLGPEVDAYSWLYAGVFQNMV